MTEVRALASGEDEKLDLWNSIPFFAAHAVAIVAPFFLPFSWKLVALAVLLYYARMAGTTIGYHRYASHRGFKTSRAFQFVLAFWAQTSGGATSDGSSASDTPRPERSRTSRATRRCAG